jgi:putative two-component system response regulator
MHDIGKIGIPDIILKKPGRLTDAEFSVMRTHTTIGKEMLSDSSVPILHIASEIAGSHHEYWNGDGYPEGLKGDSITVSARIISIVDVYDALVHRRVYKTAFEENVALEMMRGLVGIQFDPELFAVFIDNLEEMRDIRNAVIDL